MYSKFENVSEKVTFQKSKTSGLFEITATATNATCSLANLTSSLNPYDDRASVQEPSTSMIQEFLTKDKEKTQSLSCLLLSFSSKHLEKKYILSDNTLKYSDTNLSTGVAIKVLL